MLRWLLVYTRNRIAAVLFFAASAAILALMVPPIMRTFGYAGGIAVVVVAFFALIWLLSRAKPLHRLGGRMADEERALGPRQRL